MISFMVPTKPDWSGLVLSTQNLSYNSEFVSEIYHHGTDPRSCLEILCHSQQLHSLISDNCQHFLIATDVSERTESLTQAVSE